MKNHLICRTVQHLVETQLDQGGGEGSQDIRERRHTKGEVK